jgi:hypothetical protein
MVATHSGPPFPVAARTEDTVDELFAMADAARGVDPTLYRALTCRACAKWRMAFWLMALAWAVSVTGAAIVIGVLS